MLAGIAGGRPEAVVPNPCDTPAPDNVAPSTPAWTQRDLDNMRCAAQRLEDQYANPALHQKFATETPVTYSPGIMAQVQEPSRPRITAGQILPGARNPDPYRVPAEWQASGRGRVLPISFISIHRGAKHEGEIWLPPEAVPGPHPAVVFTTGTNQKWRHLYFWLAEGLAEAGYMVMTYDTQGQGGSENFSHDDDGSLRSDPTLNPEVNTFFLDLTDAITFLFSTPTARYGVDAPNYAGTDRYNPAWASLDRLRVGLAGHSLGGVVSIWAGQDDFRITAIVSYNATGNILDEILPRAHSPTLYMNSDYGNIGPRPFLTAPGPFTKQVGYCQLVGKNQAPPCKADQQELGIDAMQVALRSSTHFEWAYVPYGQPASRYGERVSMYYTLAWFDAYLKGMPDAFDRLAATTFNGSADASSIGAGTFEPDPAGGFRNVPYRIAGSGVALRLSFYFRSSYWLKGGTLGCNDMRSGPCPIG